MTFAALHAEFSRRDLRPTRCNSRDAPRSLTRQSCHRHISQLLYTEVTRSERSRSNNAEFNCKKCCSCRRRIALRRRIVPTSGTTERNDFRDGFGPVREADSRRHVGDQERVYRGLSRREKRCRRKVQRSRSRGRKLLNSDLGAWVRLGRVLRRTSHCWRDARHARHHVR